MAGLALMLALFAGEGRAEDSFIVLHVNPSTAGMVPGTLYSDGEFIFVPAGATVVLMDAKGERYVIEGLAALPAEAGTFSRHRFDPEANDGRSIVEFLFTGVEEEVLAAGRTLKSDEAAKLQDNHPAFRLHTGFLQRYRDGERYCIIGDALTVRRLSQVGSDAIELTVDGQVRLRSWDPGTRELTFEPFLGDDWTRATAAISTREGEFTVEILRLPDDLLEQGLTSVAATFAKRNCTLQALLISDG
ncbi:MAG: hypothetical protein VYD64_01390 [Pseudomonadota bacterium]|nr:hypothetical protein [Pseudomonadota bacterium]